MAGRAGGEAGGGVLLEVGAELGGTTCVPVATSPDSEDVRLVCCTEGAAGSQRSGSTAALPAPMSAPGMVGCTEGAAVHCI